MITHVLIHVSILGLAGVSLAMLWEHSPRYLFALLLVAMVVYGIAMFWFAWSRRPSYSILTVLVSRLRGYPATTTDMHPSPSSSMPMVNSTNPYTHHRPPYHPTHGGDSDMSYHNQHAAPMSVDTDDNDDDMDDDARQRAIEEEMERRDVSIITVPRRKLTIANPS